MWKVLSYVLDIRLSFRCDQCGAMFPFRHGESRSIQTGRWVCGTLCYSAFIDAAIGEASPAVEYDDGTDWDDTVETMLNQAGAMPSIRLQLYRSMEKFYDEFEPPTSSSSSS